LLEEKRTLISGNISKSQSQTSDVTIGPKQKRKILKLLLKKSSPTSVLVLNLKKQGPTLQLRQKWQFQKNAATLKKSHHNF